MKAAFSALLAQLGGGGLHVWSRKEKRGERTKILASRNQKRVSLRTDNNLQPWLEQSSVLPLGVLSGCALHSGLLNDSIWRTKNR